MQSLPYELLQLIAGNLLPCYQCRLAMTSRHCYKYLYNDLLRWHTRKVLIQTPKYNITRYAIEIHSIRIHNDKIVIYNDYTKSFDNMTTGKSSSEYGSNRMWTNYFERYLCVHYNLLCIYRNHLHRIIKTRLIRMRTPIYILFKESGIYRAVANYLDDDEENNLYNAIYA